MTTPARVFVLLASFFVAVSADCKKAETTSDGKVVLNCPEDQMTVTVDPSTSQVEYKRSISVQVDPVDFFFVQEWDRVRMQEKLTLRGVIGDRKKWCIIKQEKFPSALSPTNGFFHLSANLDCFFVFPRSEGGAIKSLKNDAVCFSEKNQPRRSLAEVGSSIFSKVGNFFNGVEKPSPEIDTDDKELLVTVSCDGGKYKYVAKKNSEADPYRFATAWIGSDLVAIADKNKKLKKFAKTNYLEAICQRMRKMNEAKNSQESSSSSEPEETMTDKNSFPENNPLFAGGKNVVEFIFQGEGVKVTKNLESHTIDLERSITLFVDPVHILLASGLNAEAIKEKLLNPWGLAITGKDCRFVEQSLESMFKVGRVKGSYRFGSNEQCLFEFSPGGVVKPHEDHKKCFSVKSTDVGGSRPKFVIELNPKFFILDCLDGNKYYIPLHISSQKSEFEERSETEICEWMKTGQLGKDRQPRGDRAETSVVMGGSACRKHEAENNKIVFTCRIDDGSVTRVIIEKNGSEIEFQRNVVAQVDPVLSFLAKGWLEQDWFSLNGMLEKCDIDQNNKLSNELTELLPGPGSYHVGAYGDCLFKLPTLKGSENIWTEVAPKSDGGQKACFTKENLPPKRSISRHVTDLRNKLPTIKAVDGNISVSCPQKGNPAYIAERGTIQDPLVFARLWVPMLGTKVKGSSEGDKTEKGTLKAICSDIVALAEGEASAIKIKRVEGGGASSECWKTFVDKDPRKVLSNATRTDSEC